MATKKSKAIFSGILTILGAGAGYFYYVLFGCKRGCLITSSPIRTVIYFAIIFVIFSTIFWKDKKKNEKT
jgi:hypothetical protein